MLTSKKKRGKRRKKEKIIKKKKEKERKRKKESQLGFLTCYDVMFNKEICCEIYQSHGLLLQLSLLLKKKKKALSRQLVWFSVIKLVILFV